MFNAVELKIFNYVHPVIIQTLKNRLPICTTSTCAYQPTRFCEADYTGPNSG